MKGAGAPCTTTRAYEAIRASTSLILSGLCGGRGCSSAPRRDINIPVTEAYAPIPAFPQNAPTFRLLLKMAVRRR